jgi:transcriptional regulator with XRE-family HTH domain
MKNMNNKKLNIDPIAKARKGKYFEQFSREAKERIKLGVEIYNAREILGMSQQKLAKEAQTTQKVISRVENGDVNIGFALLNRIASVLNFNYRHWSNILDFSIPIFEVSKTISNTADRVQENVLFDKAFNLSIKSNK